MLMLKIIHILTFVKKFMKKILTKKLVIMLGNQNTKIFLLKDIVQIGLKKFLWIKMLKILFHGHVISDLNVEKTIRTFYEKELQKPSQKEFRIAKVIKKKVTNYMSNGKYMIIHS